MGNAYTTCCEPSKEEVADYLNQTRMHPLQSGKEMKHKYYMFPDGGV